MTATAVPASSTAATSSSCLRAAAGAMPPRLHSTAACEDVPLDPGDVEDTCALLRPGETHSRRAPSLGKRSDHAEAARPTANSRSTRFLACGRYSRVQRPAA
jgi:hypothetical protein